MWTYRQLLRLKVLTARGADTCDVARGTQHTAAEVDIARWQLLGRTIEQACDNLNIPILSEARDEGRCNGGSRAGQ